jgi:hypothetical protein
MHCASPSTCTRRRKTSGWYHCPHPRLVHCCIHRSARSIVHAPVLRHVVLTHVVFARVVLPHLVPSPVPLAIASLPHGAVAQSDVFLLPLCPPPCRSAGLADVRARVHRQLLIVPCRPLLCPDVCPPQYCMAAAAAAAAAVSICPPILLCPCRPHCHAAHGATLRRYWRVGSHGGGGVRNLLWSGGAVWLFARVEFLHTFVVFLHEKSDKLLTSC